MALDRAALLQEQCDDVTLPQEQCDDVTTHRVRYRMGLAEEFTRVGR